MSRVISGWVVSKTHLNHSGLRWGAWRSGELKLYAETYRDLLAAIREANRARA